MPSKSGTNANKPFHIFSLKRFLLWSFQPASPCNIHQCYNHQGTLRSSIFSHAKSRTCTESCAEGKPGDASQPDGPGAQLPSAPCYVAAPLHALWQGPSPLYVCLYPLSFCLLPLFGLEFFQDRNHLCQNSASLSIPKMTKRCLPVMIHGSLYFKAFSH